MGLPLFHRFSLMKNNSGERDIRIKKVQQIISGTFRSFKGVQSFCTIKSYISKPREHDISAFEGILSGFQNIDIPGKLMDNK